MDDEYPMVWRVRTRLPERFGQSCRIDVFGGKNTCLVVFPDGFKVTTCRWYVRKKKGVTSASVE